MPLVDNQRENTPMHRWRPLFTALSTALVALLLTHSAVAQDEPEISDLSYLDRQYMQQQRSALDDLARRYLGRQFNGVKEHDLGLLQTLLDRRLVRPDQTDLLQGMGFILGDLLAQELGMRWVVYTDRVGRSRALRLGDSDNYLFPVTMISRRREVGNTTPVDEIYQRAYDTISSLREPLPFQ
jgi:hypothetical protein